MTEYIIFRLKLVNAERLLQAYDQIVHDKQIIKQYFDEIRSIVEERKTIKEKRIPNAT